MADLLSAADKTFFQQAIRDKHDTFANITGATTTVTVRNDATLGGNTLNPVITTDDFTVLALVRTFKGDKDFDNSKLFLPTEIVHQIDKEVVIHKDNLGANVIDKDSTVEIDGNIHTIMGINDTKFEIYIYTMIQNAG